MITEPYEVYSLEEGDTIILNDAAFTVKGIEGMGANETLLRLIDEEGYSKSLVLSDHAKVEVVCEEASDVL